MEHDLTVVSAVSESAPLPAMPQLNLDLSRFYSGRWAAQLDAEFARRPTPSVIVAQGVACLAVAWWAQLSPASYVRQVGGAIFLSALHVPPGRRTRRRQLAKGR